MKRIGIAVVAAVVLFGGVSLAAQETVRLGYELTLTRCAAGNCHTDPAAKGEADIELSSQEANGATGTQTVQMHADGVQYTTVLKAWSQPPQNRGVDVTLAGVTDPVAGSSSSFHAHQAARCVAWDTLPLVTLTADAYMKNGEQVTPALHLKVIGK